jgi:hypothetical protein
VRLLQPRRGGVVVLGVKLDADELAAKLAGCDQCGTGTGERVEHDAARRTESLDQRPEGGDWLLCRVQLVAGVGKFQHVRDRVRRGLSPFAST